MLGYLNLNILFYILIYLMNLELTKTLGRTGNTMVCIMCAIDFCLENNIKSVSFPKIQWWSEQLLKDMVKQRKIFVFENDIECKLTNEKHGSASWNEEKKQYESWFIGFYRDTPSFEKRIELVQKYILPIFNVHPIESGNNDLVIHIRAGDIFDRNHYAYIQPPLCFYTEIIESKKWDKIFIVTENRKNPCFDYLISKYDNITHFLDDSNRHGGNGWGFQHDLDMMLGCKNFVVSNSSLSPLVIQMSKTINNVYIPSYCFHKGKPNATRENQLWWSMDFSNKDSDFICNNIKFNVLNYDKYTEKTKAWEYTNKDNIDYIINYQNK